MNTNHPPVRQDGLLNLISDIETLDIIFKLEADEGVITDTFQLVEEVKELLDARYGPINSSKNRIVRSRRT